MFDASIIKGQIVEWIAGYFRSSAPPGAKAVVGISGGKDSSVVAALCANALGADRVLGVLMPQGRQHDIDVSYKLCDTLGIPFVVVNIDKPVGSLFEEIGRTGLKLNSFATINTPARIRMTTLYAVSGIVGGRVANTCNLSEDWVGYSTKFGDSAGDFSPLASFTVTEVKAIGREIGLSGAFIDKTPIDGISGKTDEDNLGFTYEVLDRYIREGLCEDKKIKEKIDGLHMASRHKITPIPTFR